MYRQTVGEMALQTDRHRVGYKERQAERLMYRQTVGYMVIPTERQRDGFTDRQLER